MSSPLRHHLSKNKNTRAQNWINESSAICWSTQETRNKRLATSFQLYPQPCFHVLWLSVSWLSNLPENLLVWSFWSEVYSNIFRQNYKQQYSGLFSAFSFTSHRESTLPFSDKLSFTFEQCCADCASRSLLWCSAVHETCTLLQHISTPAANAGETPQSTVKYYSITSNYRRALIVWLFEQKQDAFWIMSNHAW